MPGMDSPAHAPIQGAPSLAMIRKVAFASCIGSMVEWYDFFIYATASALVFNKLFFPNLDPLVGSLVALSTYATGFLARPVGGIIFGIIGDRKGRKAALVLTLLMVGIATVVVGLLPTYETIGSWGAVVLVLVRLVHGVGVGGEQGNAILITFEHAPVRQRGFYSSLVQLGAPGGFVLPLGVFAVLDAVLPPGQFLAWGWRVPFLLSAVLVGIGMYIRLSITESPLFKQQRTREAAPLRRTLRDYARPIWLGLGAKLAEGAVFTIYAVMYSAIATAHGVPRGTMTRGALIAIVLELGMLPVFGALSDRVGRRPVYAFGCAVSLLIAIPAFAIVQYDLRGLLWLALVAGLAVGHAAMYAPQASFFSELFPTGIRATGVSFIQQIGAMLGSVGSMAAGWFLTLGSNGVWLLAGYVALNAAVSLTCALSLPETAPCRTGVGAEAPSLVTEG